MTLDLPDGIDRRHGRRRAASDAGDGLTMSRPPLSKDTTLCISLAGRPSNIGTRFHNYLYDQLGIDFIYKAFTTTDIAAAMAGVRALGIRGCSVSMPFKQDVLGLVDKVEQSALAIQSVNTVVNDHGVLTASNTDYIAVQRLIADYRLDPGRTVLIYGSGGMARRLVRRSATTAFATEPSWRATRSAVRRWLSGSATTGVRTSAVRRPRSW